MTNNISKTIKIVKFPEDSIFSNSRYLRLWGAQLSSQSAIHMLNFVLAVTIYNATRSSQSVSFLIASFGLSALLFGALAGVIVDHSQKKKAMIYSTISRFFLVLLLMLVTHNVATTVILAFLLNSITQFFFPAEGATIPLIVDKKNLITANSIYTLSFYASQIIGYMFAGIFLEKFGLNNTLLIIAGLFLLAFGFLYSIEFPKEEHTKYITLGNAIKEVSQEMKEGFKYIARHPDIRESLLYMGAGGLIIGMFLVLLPGYGVEVLSLKAEKTSLYLVTPLAIGIVTGAALINKFVKRFSRDKIINIGMILASIGLILLSLTRRIPINQIKSVTSKFEIIQEYLPSQVNRFLGVDILLFAMIFMFIIGFANSFIEIINNTNLQDHTERHMRGRVYGVLQTFIILFAAFPVLITGFVADNIGITPMIAISGIFLFSFHVVIRLKYKKPIW